MTVAEGLRRLRIPVTARGWHSLFGMGFLLILMFLFVTGTLSVFGREIDWLVNPAQRVVPADTGKLPFGASFDAVRVQIPDALILNIIRMPGARYADQVTVALPDRQGRRLLLVDPYVGQVTGIGSPNTVWFVLRELHRGLSSKSDKVRLAVAGMALPLGGILVTSLWLYRRFYAGLFRWPRKGARRRAVLGDLHRLIGAWVLIFLVPLVLTSLIFALELVGISGGPYPAYMAMGTRDTGLPDGFAGADLDRMVAAAVDHYPGLVVTDVALPAQAMQPVVVRGDLSALLVRSVANAVYFDPATSAIRGAHRGEDISAGLRLYEASRTLHYGSFGGLPSRILWAVFGSALSVLAVLGALIYAERLVFMADRSDSIRTRSRLGHVWAGMGLGNWLGLAVLALAFALTLRRLLGG